MLFPNPSLCLIVFLSLSVYAQAQSRLDSLQKVAQNSDLPAKERAVALYTLADHYKASHPDSTMYYAEQHLALATASQDLAAQGLALEMKSIAYLAQNQAKEAFNSLHAGLGLCQQVSDSSCIGKILYGFGSYYFGKKNFDSAAYYFQESLAIGEAQNEPEQMIAPISGLGLVAANTGKQEEALAYSQQTIELMEKANKRTGIGLIYRNIAHIYVQRGDYENGAAYCQRSVDAFEAEGNYRGMGGSLNGLGLIAYYQKDYKKSLSHYEKALSLNEKNQDPDLQAMLLGNRGMIYSAQGNLDKAIEDYTLGLQIHREIGNPIGVANKLGHIGQLYLRQEENRAALRYFHQGLAIYDSIGNQMGKPDLLQKIAYAHNRLREYSPALTYAKEGLELSREIGLKRNEANLLIELGDAYMGKDQYTEAKPYLLQALQIVREIRPNSASRPLDYLARLAVKQESWQEASKYAEEGLALAKKTNNLAIIKGSSETLWKAQQALGQYRKALETYQLFVQTSDSLADIENQSAIIRAEYKEQALTDSLNNAKTLALQVAETKRRTTVSYVLLGGLFVTLVLGILLWNRFRLTKRQNQMIAEEKMKLDLAYEELNVANEKLTELDSFKSQFFTNISHEFRTPLTVIGGMMDQVEKQPKQWLEKGSEIIRRNVNNLLALINQILDLRKLESGQLGLQPIQADIVSFLRLGTASFESMADSKGIRLEFKGPSEAVLMDFDPEKLRQIQSNLLSNAIKFTPTGGEIEVTVDQASEKFLRLRVADSGIGIPTEKIPLIFDRFYQVDGTHTREGEGSGVGLSLVRELTQLMGGEIQVESKLGEGTTMILTLPISQLAPVQPSPVVGAQVQHMPLREETVNDLPIPPLASGERPSLLIIEDNPDIVEYLFACLEDQYDLMAAMDGEAGIEAALEQIPDLIITDVMMPKKNGYEVCEVLKHDTRTSHIPIVMLTAKADQPSRVEGYKRGADAYLAKPFDEEELLVRLAKLLEIRRTLQLRYAQGTQPPASEDPAIQVEDAFIIACRELILENIQDTSYRGEALARDMATSKTNFFRKIKALTGKSPSHFIRQVKMDRARELLQQQDLQAAEVAYLVGFNEATYFHRVFQQTFGVSPGEWRKKHS